MLDIDRRKKNIFFSGLSILAGVKLDGQTSKTHVKQIMQKLHSSPLRTPVKIKARSHTLQ